METTPLATAEHIQVSSINDIKRKMHFTGSIIKTTLAGAVVDIGLEVPGVLHISQIRKDPVNKVEDVLQVGQLVDVWVKRVDIPKGRIELTMIEPLAMEWRELSKDMVIQGKVTRLEKFGVFVDVGAERPGLVHISELTHDFIKNPHDVVKQGDEVSVKVLSVNRRKKQIKLSIKALEEPEPRIPRKPKKAKEKEKEEPREAPIEKDETVPTAMEIALREAMERSKSRNQEGQSREKQKEANRDAEREGILSRTLEHKARTTPK